jgi:hypothetical protein
MNLAKEHDYGRAEQECRSSLGLTGHLPPNVRPRFENVVRAMLAATLLKDGKQQDEREAPRPTCRAPPAEQPPQALRKSLADGKLSV